LQEHDGHEAEPNGWQSRTVIVSNKCNIIKQKQFCITLS
jgi:hypothetical protein